MQLSLGDPRSALPHQELNDGTRLGFMTLVQDEVFRQVPICSGAQSLLPPAHLAHLVSV